MFNGPNPYLHESAVGLMKVVNYIFILIYFLMAASLIWVFKSQMDRYQYLIVILFQALFILQLV